MQFPLRPSTGLAGLALIVASVTSLVGCGAKTPAPAATDPAAAAAAAGAALVPTGSRQIERIQYNDVTDLYRVFLVGRANVNEPERLAFLRLQHMSDADFKAGKKPFLKADAGGPIAVVGSGFSLGVLHGFTEERTDNATGRKVNVVARSEKRFWSPFGGKALVDGADPFAEPQFLYPPPVRGPGPLVGIGGRGPTKEAAAENYRQSVGQFPQAVKLKTEGFEGGIAEDGKVTAPPPQFSLTPPPPADPVTALDNKIIGATPGSLADHRQRGDRNGGAKKQGKKHK